MTRKYSEETLREAVQNCTSLAQVLRYLGLKDAGGNRTNLKQSLSNLGIDTSHFTGQSHLRGSSSPHKKSWHHYLVKRSEGSRKLASDRLRRAMIEYGFEYQCAFYDCPSRNGWINGEVPIEIDHINGDNLDNTPENLRFLCPICHAQQPTSSHSWKTAKRYGTKSACDCGNPKRGSSLRCMDCYNRSRKSRSRGRRPTKARPLKIQWPEVDILARMVDDCGYSEVGRQLGVSDNAVRKRLRTRSASG